MVRVRGVREKERDLSRYERDLRRCLIWALYDLMTVLLRLRLREESETELCTRFSGDDALVDLAELVVA